MGIYYCNHCKHIAESAINVQVAQIQCGNCGQLTKVYETVFFVKSILERWAVTKRELQSFKEQDSRENDTAISQDRYNGTEEIKFSDSNRLANEQQHKPLAFWFQRQYIEPQFDYDAVNMQGFYDEASQMIGENYAIFNDFLGKINWAYRKNVTTVNFDLSKYSQKDGQLINKICQAFYSHTLFAKYNYQKQDKLIHLKLQKAPQIQAFFSGGWLEWYALNGILNHIELIEKFGAFSIARNVKIRFKNEDLHELDVVFYASGKLPLVIECKSGEFRNEIDKYLRLQKRLNLPASNFVILSTHLDETQAHTLNGMYNLTFLTLNGFQKFIIEQLN